MRIVSLLPAATDAIVAMGWGHDLVGVTHACPPLPGATVVTRAQDLSATSAADIDRAGAGSTDHHSLFALDRTTLAAARPDLVVTQATCSACAPSIAEVEAAACSLGIEADVFAYDPHRLDDIPASIERLGTAIGALRDALSLASHLRNRIEFTRKSVAAAPRPRVAAIEWPDPPYAPGHWVPDVIEAAGATSVLGTPGERSEPCHPADIAAAEPNVVLLAFCGFDLAAVEQRSGELRMSTAARVLAVDADRLLTRPGPQIADGVEALAWALHRPHPDLQPGVGAVAEWNGAAWDDLGFGGAPLRG